jgi:hypothetical protein
MSFILDALRKAEERHPTTGSRSVGSGPASRPTARAGRGWWAPCSRPQHGVVAYLL